MQGEDGAHGIAAPVIIGILNITADSFSDGGRYLEPGAAVEKGLSLAAEGADQCPERNHKPRENRPDDQDQGYARFHREGEYRDHDAGDNEHERESGPERPERAAGVAFVDQQSHIRQGNNGWWGGWRRCHANSQL